MYHVVIDLQVKLPPVKVGPYVLVTLETNAFAAQIYFLVP